MNQPLTVDELFMRLDGPPKRVISLVPSYTQSLFDLGLGDCVEGITDYCNEPAEALAGVARVGGPKTLNLEFIQKLKPDLVLANQEENSAQDILALQEAGLPVWLSFPRSVKEMFTFLADLVRFFGNQRAATQVRLLEDGFDWAVQASIGRPRLKLFCPIWQERDPEGEIFWMTFNRETYSSDLLELLGGENIFARRERRYPLAADLDRAESEDAGKRDTRYPRVSRVEILRLQPEVILLPDEPFNFDARAEAVVSKILAETPAVRDGRVYRIDGRLITWYGTHIRDAIVELPNLFSQSPEEQI